MPQTPTFSEIRQEFAACYEAFFWTNGYIPHKVSDLNFHFKTNFTEEHWQKCLSDDSLRKYFRNRSVPLPDEIKPVLHPKQLKFLTLLFDPTDNRPLALKLKDSKTTSSEYSAWMRDEDFVSLLRSEADKRFSQGRTSVLQALQREASKPGANVQAIKLYLTITGDYTESQQAGTTININQDIRQLTQKLLEILQRHVPPETLALVHGEMEQLLFPEVKTSKAAAPLTRTPLSLGAVETTGSPKNELEL